MKSAAACDSANLVAYDLSSSRRVETEPRRSLEICFMSYTFSSIISRRASKYEKYPITAAGTSAREAMHKKSLSATAARRARPKSASNFIRQTL